MDKEALNEHICSKMRDMIIVMEYNGFKIKIPKLNLEKVKAAKLKEAYTWLKDFFANEYTTLAKAWALRTPEIWANYKIVGLKDTREQLILLNARRLFKEVWLERPIILKGKYENHKDTPQVSSQEV